MPCVVFQLRENTLESTTNRKHSILLKFLVDPCKINDPRVYMIYIIYISLRLNVPDMIKCLLVLPLYK